MLNALPDKPSTTDRQAPAKSATGGRRTPAPRNSKDTNAELLAFEHEVRSIDDERELDYHLCNSCRRIIPFQQCFYGSVARSGAFTLKSASSISIIDRNAPFTRWLEGIANRLIEKVDTEQVKFTLPAYCDDADDEQHTYPYKEFLWTPQVRKGQLVGGILMAKSTLWTDNDCLKTLRMSDLYLHAKAAVKGGKELNKTRVSIRPLAWGALVLAGLLSILPVSITALAPVEVVPRQPYVLAAPFDGVVKAINASQGQELSAGDTVIEFDDVHLLNETKLAEQRAAIAQARYQRASQGAIANPQVKREIEVAKAEYELALAESRYANELLDQARLQAPVPGIAIFSDKSDWEGKPVAAGEAIVAVADPKNVQLDIDLPVKESIVLSDGARVKIFLDSDPLNPLEARLTEASYRAQPDKRDILSYALTAELADPQAQIPRIGVQGTAQVFSDKASLAYVIFRRPITAVRQYIGW